MVARKNVLGGGFSDESGREKEETTQESYSFWQSVRLVPPYLPF